MPSTYFSWPSRPRAWWAAAPESAADVVGALGFRDAVARTIDQRDGAGLAREPLRDALARRHAVVRGAQALVRGVRVAFFLDLPIGDLVSVRARDERDELVRRDHVTALDLELVMEG